MKLRKINPELNRNLWSYFFYQFEEYDDVTYDDLAEWVHDENPRKIIYKGVCTGQALGDISHMLNARLEETPKFVKQNFLFDLHNWYFGEPRELAHRYEDTCWDFYMDTLNNFMDLPYRLLKVKLYEE